MTDQTIMGYIFFTLGLALLSCVNVIIAESAFFSSFLKSHEVNSKFSTINNCLAMLGLIFFQKYGTIISYPQQLYLYVILMLVILLTLPLIVINLDESISFPIILLYFGFAGLGNAIGNNSVFALAGFFNKDTPNPSTKANSGIGFAGVLTSILNIFIMLKVGNKTEGDIKKGAFFIFYIFAGLLVLCLLLIKALHKRPHFIEVMTKNRILTGVITEKRKKLIQNSHNTEIEAFEEEESTENDEEIKAGMKGEDVSVIELYKKISPALIGVFTIFAVSWIAYPTHLFRPQLFDIDFGLKVNIILLLYNAFDILGKEIGDKITCNKTNLYTIIFSRPVLLILVFFNIYANEAELISNTLISLLTIINPILLGFTNGVGTSLAFRLPGYLVEDKLKGRAGSSATLFLAFGMMVGSVASMLIFGMLQ